MDKIPVPQPTSSTAFPLDMRLRMPYLAFEEVSVVDNGLPVAASTDGVLQHFLYDVRRIAIVMVLAFESVTEPRS